MKHIQITQSEHESLLADRARMDWLCARNRMAILGERMKYLGGGLDRDARTVIDRHIHELNELHRKQEIPL